MGQKATFDPINKIIQITSSPVGGEVTVDVKVDLYSDMKEDWLANHELSKYRPPISVVGGNPLPGSKALGTTFFLNSAWKIRPYEGSHRFLVNGNLYSTDGSSPFTETIGTFNIIIESTVSSLVDSTVQQLAEIEYSSFVNGLWLSLSGSAGTGGLQGNAQNHVNNVPDLRTIQANRGLPKTIYVIGNYIFNGGDDVSGYHLIGQKPSRTLITFNEAALTTGTIVSDAKVTGNLDGNTHIENCEIDALNYINGRIKNCELTDTRFTLGGLASDIATFINCSALEPNNTRPIIDGGGDGPGLTMTDYSGDIRLENKTGLSAYFIGVDQGQVIIDLTTCTAGKIIISGVGTVTDQNDNHLTSGTYSGLTIVNETHSGSSVTVDNNAIALAVEAQLSDEFANISASVDTNAIALAVEAQLADDFANITVDNNAIASAVQTVLNDDFASVNSNINAVVNDIWHGAATNYQAVGSMGELLHQASQTIVDTNAIAIAVRAEMDAASTALAAIYADTQNNIPTLIAALPTDTSIAAAVWGADFTLHQTASSFGLMVSTTIASQLSAIFADTDVAIPGLIGALNDFNPLTDTVAHVNLVDTVTTNTDMRGTDGAATTVPTVTQIRDEMDQFSTQFAQLRVAVDTTIPGLIAALHDFNPATDSVQHVVLVDTVTTNTDMRGTDFNAADITTLITQTNKLHQIEFNKRKYDKANNKIYVYDTDGITPLYSWDTVSNASESTMTPI